MSLFENVKHTIDGMGQVELSGIKLESADARLLDVGSLDFSKHIAMQPAAIAFFGAMKKEATRRQAILKRSYDRWQKKRWAMSKAAVLSGSTAQYKPTLADIESRFIIDNEAEIEEWDKKMDKVQEESDTLDSWYEAWRQKSFSLREFSSIDEDERWNAGSSMGGGPESHNGGGHGGNFLDSNKIREVKDIINRRRQQSQRSS